MKLFKDGLFPVGSLLLLCATLLVACDNNDDNIPAPDPDPVLIADNLIICNEGNYGSDNGQLSFLDCETGQLTNGWFREVNGKKLGDAPTDIVQINDNLIAISINSSNLIQFITTDGKECGEMELPNVRRLCTDGKYLYTTSYAHFCGDKKFEKGFVAKIDVPTKQVVATCEVGWEPEGIRLYNGKLFVANSGGYAYSEDHDYETTVQIINATTMTVEKTIDTGCANLYGEVSQAGKYLCINASGNYYDIAPATVILNCETATFECYPFPCTYNATDGSVFFTVGSEFSYETYAYTYHIHTINPATSEVSDIIINNEITDEIKSLAAPYCLYVSPITGNLYFTDAKDYTTAGELYGYKNDGERLFEPLKLYVNPSKILAVKSE